ncbi:Fip1-domain-containing protein [Gyrodon lividus]|nr:Fip1-domain-containing protein [Gyrodon lividus]
MDDDDAFLYGGTDGTAVVATSVSQLLPIESVKPSNGVVTTPEPKTKEEPPFGPVLDEEDLDIEEENGAGEEEESEEDDIEIIIEPTSRSLDFRQQNATGRLPAIRSTSQTSKPPPSLTTEYTLRERGSPAKPALLLPTSVPQSSLVLTSTTPDTRIDEGPDPSTLPHATAPPSYPSINPDLPGILDGRSILEVDLSAMAEKPWRLPGSDISDWFNYGFDEISWEAYCYRRRDLGELANVLKTNVLNFAAMPEDQLTALPPELRTMVMTGANAMMNGNSNTTMMGSNVGMNAMMDMSGMGAMNMPMGLGMNGDLGMQMQAGGPMMQDGPGPGPVGPVVTNGTPEQGVQMGMQDGFGGGPGPGMMGMGMGGDYGMQQEQGPMGQGMYPGMEASATPVPVPVQTPVQGHTPALGHSGRGAPPAQFRGRAMAQGLRGRGGFVSRGRGRYDGPPPGPPRPASPLPPGVPTGPRNQNRYKDRDGNAPAVEGLDYGGTSKDGGARTPSGEPEDRGHSRKRRMSPGLDDTRGSKRR